MEKAKLQGKTDQRLPGPRAGEVFDSKRSHSDFQEVMKLFSTLTVITLVFIKIRTVHFKKWMLQYLISKFNEERLSLLLD